MDAGAESGTAAGELRVCELGPEDLARANAIYAGLGFAPSDGHRHRTFAGCEDGELVALGRLAEHEDGALEVGGFWVRDDRRGRGYARRLVASVLALTPTDRRIWCLPFAHLVSFYATFGFDSPGSPASPGPADVLPASIRDRLAACGAACAPSRGDPVEKGRFPEVAVLSRVPGARQ